MSRRAAITIVTAVTLTMLTGACRSETPQPVEPGTPIASPSPVERSDTLTPSPQASPIPEASLPVPPSTPEPAAEAAVSSPTDTPTPSATQPRASTPSVTPTAEPATPPAPVLPPSPDTVHATIPGFELPSFTVATGTTVVWTNEHGALHTVTHAEGGFDSGPLQRGNTFNHTFATPGMFAYLCTVHPSMTGTVTVE